MTPAEVARRWIDDVKNAKNPSAAAEVMSPNFTNYATMHPDIVRPGEHIFTVLREALPDLRIELIQQVTEGDRVVNHQRFSGTYTGTFREWRGDGRAVSWEVIDIVTVVDGRIEEHWAVADTLALAGALRGAPEATGASESNR